MNDLPVTARYAIPTLVAAFCVLLLAERLRPLRARKGSTAQRLFINFCLTALAFVVGTFMVRPVGIGLASWAALRAFGLLHLFPLPWPAQFALGFLLMDLTFYYWHRANHVIPLLWRFHRVHHVDPDLDVTTSFRFHFGEILYSSGFRVIQVGGIGVSPAIYMAYEFFFELATLFHHTNLRLPLRLERVLNKFVVTPRMHGIHHSAFRNETNTDYSVIFRWWDAAHRSLRLNIPQREVLIGAEGYEGPEDSHLANLLVQPFRKQRGPAAAGPVIRPSSTAVSSSWMLE